MTISAVPQGSVIPAQQNPNPAGGTNFTANLVSVDTYARLTGDSAEKSDDLGQALADAEWTAAKRCNRTLKFGQYTELLYVYKKGLVYPSALPIAAVVDPNLNQQGPGVWIGFFIPLPSMPAFTGTVPPQANVTYWGGFTDETIPPLLARCIARLAWYALHSTSQPGQPPGADSVSVGGASIHGDLSQFVIADQALNRDLRRFTRPQAHGWQS